MKKIAKKKNKKKDSVRAIVFVHGKDCAGIIYRLSNELYNFDINILDVKQTVLAGFFNMMMVIDIAKIKNIHDVKVRCEKISKELDIAISIQLEDTYLAMHEV